MDALRAAAADLADSTMDKLREIATEGQRQGPSTAGLGGPAKIESGYY